MVVLDTDHASELGMRSAAGLRLLDRLDQSGESPAITAITVEEQMRGNRLDAWRAVAHTKPTRFRQRAGASSRELAGVKPLQAVASLHHAAVESPARILFRSGWRC